MIMSVEAQVLFEQLNQLPEDEKREIALCILEHRPLAKRRSVREIVNKHRPLFDDGLTDHNHQFAEAIMASKRMK